MSQNILLTQSPESESQSLQSYQEEGGYEALRKALQELSPADVLTAVEESALRGRGGACFPTAIKWRLAAGEESAEKYVIANGGEHEPGSNKDKHLLQFYPHKVLEGMLLCAYATGAQAGYLYVIEDMLKPIAAAKKAMEELRQAKLIGTGTVGSGILGSNFAFDLQIHLAPTTYVAGEESAAIDSIEQGPGKPRKKPPYPGQAGLHGKPTTVNNVETLAHVPSIVRQGADWYQGIGTSESKGTMLFTLGEQLVNPGVYELPFGATYRQLIYDLGGGPKSGKEIRAVLPALSCAFLAAEHLDTPIDHAALKALGTSPGCGGVSLVEEGDDIVQRAQEIAQFFMDEQCGQCPPCRMETNQLVHILKGVQEGKGPGYAAQIQKITNFARGKGHCSLIEMAATPIVSAVKLFAQDFEAKANP